MLVAVFSIVGLFFWNIILVTNIVEMLVNAKKRKPLKIIKAIISGIGTLFLIVAIVFLVIDCADSIKAKNECRDALAENKLEEIEIYPNKIFEIEGSDNYEPIASLFKKGKIDSCYAFRKNYKEDSFFIAIKTKEDSFNWYEFEFKLEKFHDVQKFTDIS